MNETGPLAVPPPASGSFEERMLERLLPVPEPNLNSIPSVLARPRIESIVSFTELMKHADACGCFSIPTLNQTGLLKAAFCCTSRCVSSSEKLCRSSAVTKYDCSSAQPRIESTTRAIRPRTLFSRSAEPIWPRKYFEATMFVAVWLQLVGTSMSFCSKTGLPRSSLMTAERISHASSSKGFRPAFVKYRLNESPVRFSVPAVPRASVLGFSTGWVDMGGAPPRMMYLPSTCSTSVTSLPNPVRSFRAQPTDCSVWNATGTLGVTLWVVKNYFYHLLGLRRNR